MSEKVARAKFKCASVRQYVGGEEIEMNAISDKATPENESFTKYTPSGQLKIQVNNPALIGAFKPGQDFYIDFTTVE